MIVLDTKALVQMHSKDGLAGVLIRKRNLHMAVEPSRSQDKRSDDLSPNVKTNFMN